MSTKTFYVTNSEGNVYKCISNGAGGRSIDEIVGVSTESLRYRNDYVWKYMFTIPVTSAKEFITATEIPVLEIPIYPNRSNVYGDERELQYDTQKGLLQVLSKAQLLTLVEVLSRMRFERRKVKKFERCLVVRILQPLR